MDDPITPAPGATAPTQSTPAGQFGRPALTLRRRLDRARRRLVGVRDLESRLVAQGQRLTRLTDRVDRQGERLDKQRDLVDRLEKRLAEVERVTKGADQD
ncbi:MAG TPA: hypothetical protein VFU85_04555, partial [Nocardioides sp.]|nr:hypothetical protein [Nocardioides sp.]